MEENFNELLEKSLLDFKYKEGQIIKGTVLSIVNDTVVVDVGLKSEGRIPIKSSIPQVKSIMSKLEKNTTSTLRSWKTKRVKRFLVMTEQGKRSLGTT